jgi:acyl carrier protein
VLRQVLGIERVGRNDNFFDLGAHSLLMIRAAGALEERLARKVEVLELFQYPSIALLAQYLEGEAAALPSQEELSQQSDERRQGRSRRREMRKRSL